MTHEIIPLQPVDYLVIGHITQDLTPAGAVLGGTASYASLTALAFGLKVGIVTSCRNDLDLSHLDGIQIIRLDSEFNSTFENIYTPAGRIQHVQALAGLIKLINIPAAWRNTPIVHLGPIAREIDPSVIGGFHHTLVGITPQGWLRKWDNDGLVSFCKWPDAQHTLNHANAAVISIEDVQGDEEVVADFASYISILVVTEGAAGCRVYWNGDVRNFRPPKEVEVDPVGAGDIFATSFLIRLRATRDPWESARFATLVAANSVTRKGLLGVPRPEEITKFSAEIVEQGAL